MFFSKRLRSLSVALFLTATAALAGDQERLVRTAFDALRQSSDALDRGDHNRAASLLLGIQSTTRTLHNSAETFQKKAKDAADRTQSQLLANQTRIDETIRDERSVQTEQDNLSATIAQLTAKLNDLHPRLEQLERDMEPLHAEARKRQWCNDNVFKALFDGDCIKFGFQDLFAGRWKDLNNQIADVRRQQDELHGKLQNLTGELRGKQVRLGNVAIQRRSLETERRYLQQQSGTFRDAVTSLADASKFWAETIVLIGSKLSSIETLQESVHLLVKRADAKTPTPVFDSYDKTEITSLENSLLQFARALDNNTNILLAPR